MLIAFARHLAESDDQVGILGQRGLYHGRRAGRAIAGKVTDVSILTGDTPVPSKKMPRNSTAVLFGDFLGDPEKLDKTLSELESMTINGAVIMVLDPQELDFTYTGHVEFHGMENEGSVRFAKAQSIRAEYIRALQRHIDQIQNICAARHFGFFLQRTDRPLQSAILEFYGHEESKEPPPAAPRP